MSRKGGTESEVKQEIGEGDRKRGKIRHLRISNLTAGF